MELSKSGATFLRLQEGFVDHYYLDAAGVPTIGIGFTWASSAFRAWWNRNRPGKAFVVGAKMTRAESEAALIEVVAGEYGKAVNDFLKKTVTTQHVYDGMVSPVYNLGAISLEWKWATAIKAGRFADAAMHLRATGTTARGKKLAGLVRRRREEALLIEKGIYTGVTTTTEAVTPDAMADGVLVRGERGPAVAALIRDLAVLGLYNGIRDDVFGYGTEAAVLEFQRAHGLTADGFAGPKTLAAIKRELADTTGTSASPAESSRQPPAPANDNDPNWLAALLDFLFRFSERPRDVG